MWSIKRLLRTINHRYDCVYVLQACILVLAKCILVANLDTQRFSDFARGGYKKYHYYVFCTTVPTPSISINILNNQTVGQSLTLESTVTTVRGITSRVDIVWSSNGLVLKLTEGINHTSTSNNMVIYTDTYTVPQLNTSDEGRNIQCDTIINAISSVTASDSVTLNVTGK